jgi:hypothetical protein
MCSTSWACQQVWLALTLGGILGVAGMGLWLGPVVRRLEAERNTYREKWEQARSQPIRLLGDVHWGEGTGVIHNAADIAREVVEREKTLDKLPWLKKGGMSGSE